MSLLHPSSVGAPVALWFSNGAPVRIVYASTRFRVTAAEPSAEGWALRAADTHGHEVEFSVVARGTGWELRSAH